MTVQVPDTRRIAIRPALSAQAPCELGTSIDGSAGAPTTGSLSLPFHISTKSAHPDVNGSVDAMKELNAAIERIRAERAVPA